MVFQSTLAETYSVLTRLSVPYRLTPTTAYRLLESTFLARASVFALDAPAHVEVLQEAAEDEISGGRIYDAMIAACARRAGASVLLTFNRATLNRRRKA